MWLNGLFVFIGCLFWLMVSIGLVLHLYGSDVSFLEKHIENGHFLQPQVDMMCCEQNGLEIRNKDAERKKSKTTKENYITSHELPLENLCQPEHMTQCISASAVWDSVDPYMMQFLAVFA